MTLPVSPAESRTLIPGPLRRWLGKGLQGPPPGPRRQQHEACIFALGHYGDFVLMLSAVRLLLREYGAPRCTVVVAPNLVPLAAAELPGVELVTVPNSAGSLLREILPAWWRERRKFSRTRFERLICFNHHRSLYTEIVLSWVDARRDFRLSPLAYPPAQPDLSSELLGHWRLVETVLARRVAREEILPCLANFTTTSDRRLLVYPLSYVPAKNLPVNEVTAVLRHWQMRCAAPVVFGGASRDRGLLESYADAARAAGIANVAIETPDGVLAFFAHVAAGGALLSADSAAAHVATALDQPSVVLMGPRLWGYCQPWMKSPRQKVFLHGTSASEVAAVLPALGPK